MGYDRTSFWSPIRSGRELKTNTDHSSEIVMHSASISWFRKCVKTQHIRITTSDCQTKTMFGEKVCRLKTNKLKTAANMFSRKHNLG